MNTRLDAILKHFSDRVASDPQLSELNLQQLVRPSVRLATERVPQEHLKPGDSRIGGLPDVPPGFEWPRWLPTKPTDDRFPPPPMPDQPVPMGFIAQIDLQTIPRIDEALPDRGWLYFFYDRYCQRWGFDPVDRGCCRVMYADCDRSILERVHPPADGDPEHLAHSCRAEPRLELTLPDDLEGMTYGTPLYEAYQELCNELSGAGDQSHHHVLGYPQLIQNPMELECQLVSNGIFCGSADGYRSAEAKALAAGASDWRLLLQIDSDEPGPGWMWGDVGRIYFWIKRNDLGSLRFADVWLILQCF